MADSTHETAVVGSEGGYHYPPHLSMEQCSSEQTAEYKARLVARLVGLENIASSDLNNDCCRPSAGEETTPKQQENHVWNSFEGVVLRPNRRLWR